MEKEAIKAQMNELRNFVFEFDDAIRDIGKIIDIYQQQRTALLEKRTQLNALMDTLIAGANSGTNTKSAAGAIAIHGVIEGAHFINNALNEGLRQADEANARLEQKLKEQREWKEKHPGQQRQ